MLVEELGAPNPGVQVELSFRIYNPSGKLVGAARLPLEDMATVPWQPIAVGPEGSVYLLVPGDTEVTVYKVNPKESYESLLTHDATSYLNKENEDFSIKANVYGKFKGSCSLSRSQVRSRANQMINYTWAWYNTYNKFASGASRPSGTACDYLVGISDGLSVAGIPYCYGGWDSPWTYSDNWQWTSFANALTKYRPNNGPLVGNKTDSHGWLSGSAGIDCAGFVAAASDTYYIGIVGGDNCYKPGTSAIARDSDLIPLDPKTIPPLTPSSPNYVYYSGLQPMDIFIRTNTKPHVLFYRSRKSDGSGLETFESTADGSGQKTKIYSRTWSTLREYQARRWIGWEKRTGMDWDVAYTSKTGKSAIQGEQIWYRFTAGGQQTTITVTASSGNPDAYVYNKDLAFLIRATQSGSENFWVATTPGQVYYIKVYAQTDCSYTINWYP